METKTEEAVKGLSDTHFSFTWIIPKKTDKVLAFGQCVINKCYALKGLFIKKGSKGLYVKGAAEKGKDKNGEDKWFEHHHPITSEAYAHFQARGLEAYQNKLKETPATEQAPASNSPAHPDDDADPSML